MLTYTAMELMICCAARALEDRSTVAVGTGIPCAAAMLAQRTHATSRLHPIPPPVPVGRCRTCVDFLSSVELALSVGARALADEEMVVARAGDRPRPVLWVSFHVQEVDGLADVTT